MRKFLLLGLAAAVVIALLNVHSKPVSGELAEPPNPSQLKSGLVADATNQVVVVMTDSWDANMARVAAFVRTRTGWDKVGGDYSARIGSNGFTDGSSGRAKTTPSGAFRLVSSFGIVPNPGTAIAYRTLEPGDCWITEPGESIHRWVSAPECKAPDVPLYSATPGPHELAIVTDYDPQLAPGPPTPLFFQRYELSAGQAPLPTNGPVAMRRGDLMELLLWLDPTAQPVVVMGTREWLVGSVQHEAWEPVSKGDTGARVTEVQQALTNAGFATTIDGQFGDHTEQRVKEFQQDKALKVTGIVDTKTAAELGIRTGETTDTTAAS
jgi:L,D-peptidoglycan transpeptidase YkuD (ErfK/YbiS/YcfS/YnhG family)